MGCSIVCCSRLGSHWLYGRGTSPSLHVERLVPLLVLVMPPGRTTAANRRSVVHDNRHLHDCPVDALRCILFDVCTVCLSLWCIIEPHEGLSEPEQVSLWRQHQSTWGCRYARLPRVAPGVEHYEVALPSLHEAVTVAAVCRRWGSIIGAWASRRRYVTSASVFPSTQRVAIVTRVNCTHLSIRLHIPELLDLAVASMRNNALFFFFRTGDGVWTPLELGWSCRGSIRHVRAPALTRQLQPH